MLRSQPVLWHELICEAEELRAACGVGLANVWGHIHREDYGRARAALDAAKKYWPRIEMGE